MNKVGAITIARYGALVDESSEDAPQSGSNTITEHLQLTKTANDQGLCTQRRRAHAGADQPRAAYRFARATFTLDQSLSGRHLHFSGHNADWACSARSWNRR